MDPLSAIIGGVDSAIKTVAAVFEGREQRRAQARAEKAAREIAQIQAEMARHQGALNFRAQKRSEGNMTAIALGAVALILGVMAARTVLGAEKK